MTPDDALTITGMIASGWPGQVWEADRLAAYAKGLESLDAELTTQAVLRAQREVKYRPSVAELIEFVQIERRLSEPEQAMERRELPQPSKCPPWVLGWIVARVRHNDFRTWAEQDRFGHEKNLMPSDKRTEYIAEAEGLPIDVLFRSVGIG